MAFHLTNTDNVTDDATLALRFTSSVTTAVVGGTTYLFVTGAADNGVSVFSVASNGTLANVDNVTDDATLELEGARGVATAVVGGVTYLFVTAGRDNGVSVFSVAADGTLTNVDNVTDDATLELDFPFAVTTAVIGGTTYLFAAGLNDDGVSVFSVAADGSLTNVANVTDDATLELDFPGGVTTAAIGAATYLFVTGANDDGVSVFSVAADGALTNVDNVADDATLVLDDAFAVTTAAIGGTTYLFVTGQIDDGVSVFSVAADGALTNVDNVTDAGALELDNATSATTAAIGGTTYLFVTELEDDGVSVFSVAADGSLTNVDNVTDDATLELDGAFDVTTADVGGTGYLFVAGHDDDGVSVFSLFAETRPFAARRRPVAAQRPHRGDRGARARQRAEQLRDRGNRGFRPGRRRRRPVAPCRRPGGDVGTGERTILHRPQHRVRVDRLADRRHSAISTATAMTTSCGAIGTARS